MTLMLNERTKKKLDAFQADLPHAVLLSGKSGVGLTTAAKQLTGKDTAAIIAPTDKKGDETSNGTISVEAIRLLYEQTRAKTISRRVIIIDDADRMSLGAQAAFLKLLEEPADNTHFILTSHTAQAILPTIRSRVQIVNVEPLDASQTQAFLEQLGVTDQTSRKQLEYLAYGLPAELQRLAKNKDYFTQRAEIMSDTRTFLSGSIYERLLIVQKYHQDRSKTIQLIDSALIVSLRSLESKPSSHLITQLEKLLRTREKIEANCNSRLQLTSFVL